jgi:hypothetical protein
MSGNAILKNSRSAAICSGERICVRLVLSMEGDGNNEKWEDEGGMPLAI